MAKKIGIAAVCIVVTAVSAYFALPPRGRPEINPEDYRRPWVCEACGHEFLEPPTSGMRVCPKCGKKEAVQSYVYVCESCDKEFEAYRFKDNYGIEEAGPGGEVDPMPRFKKPGGKWAKRLADLGPLKCPHCGNDDPATLTEKVFAPGAARRAGPSGGR